MRIELLATLKEKLLTAKDFGDVLNYFFDHFGEDPEFHELGKPERVPMLEAVMLHTAQAMLGKKPKLTNVLLIRLPEHRFVHGAFTANGHMGNVFYFEDAGKGLMSIVLSISPSMTKISRFSAMPLPPAAHD